MRRIKNILKGRLTILTRNLTICDKMAVLAITLLMHAPAFSSCSASDSLDTIQEVSGGTENTSTLPLMISFNSLLDSGPLDIFTFNNDRLRKLDSYQHIESFSGGTLSISSRRGSRIVVAIANSRTAEEAAGRIFSYDDLAGLRESLSNENPEQPVMTAEETVEAGSPEGCRMTLTPLLAEIRINSISCDFHSRPYKDARLENVKIYLTNVCSRYPLTGDAPETPEELINCGGFRNEDSEEFRFPGSVSGRIDGAIGMDVVYPGIIMCCYPSHCDEESPSSPFTRVVIEGTIDGETTYYPINVNREEPGSGHQGVYRNESYIYDITITRKGVDNPDTPISGAEAGMIFSIVPWNERNHRTVTY